MMPTSRFVAAAALALFVQAQGASAQMAAPAEFPPASYRSNQFVDSQGCVFVRASIGGIASWVPRMTRDRQPLCGFQPTAIAGTSAGPAPVPLPANVPIITIPGAAATPAPVTTAAAPATPPRPAATTAAPMTTVASIATPPRIRSTQAQLPSPVITVAAPSPRIDVEATPAPLTRAQVCEGKSGIQAGYISSRTGQPLDCGPGAAAPVTLAAATPQPLATPRSGRISYEEICADIAVTGRRYVNARTGLDVRCGPQNQPVSSFTIASTAIQAPSGPTRPTGAVAPSATPVAIAQPAPIITIPSAPVVQAAAAPVSAACADFDPIAARYSGRSNLNVRCGPQAQSPSGQANVGQSGQTSNKGFANPFVRRVPASNPPRGTPAPAQPARGYKSVWDDGRINPNRGLPRVQAAAQPQIQISSRTAPQPQVQATGHRYVQVGTFGSAANAQAAVARLQSIGLPVGIGSVTRNGQVLQVVAAGPFGSAAALQAALGQARGAGFSDAFTRR